ncbi:MAG: PadR family transcriptional regulator [Firmicutes bacterium]|nr:PadR family transcriptional regulator [Bacillota bacterium]
MSLKHMILGLVREFPAYGYDVLKVIYRDFAEQGPEINKGQFYTLVQKMEDEGLINRETVQQDKTPNRKMISITPKGAAEFDHWLRSDTDETEDIRYDFFGKYNFLYKVMHFSELSREETLKKLDRQIELMKEKLDNFVRARESMLKKKVDHIRVHIIDYGIEVQKVKIEWLNKLRLELSGGPSK